MNLHPAIVALMDLRAAAEKEVQETQDLMSSLNPPYTLSRFECELIRTAFKGGAAFGVDHAKKEMEQ